MSRPAGHYVVTQGLGVAIKTMIAWYAENKFFIAGSHIPYTASSFSTISENPIDLDSLNKNQIKATTW